VKRFTSVALLLSAFFALSSLPARAADVTYTLYVNERPMMATSQPGAIRRNGVMFIDVARATRIFSGLVTYKTNSVRLLIQGATADFHIGRPAAIVKGAKIVLPGAPFRDNGEFYVPLATIAQLGNAKVRLDAQARIAYVTVGGRAVYPAAAPSPLPTSS
jgi:hypothetical protein